VSVVISPATTTAPVLISVSQATRARSGVRVVGQDVVEDGVGDLVGDLVRMALGDGFGGEEQAQDQQAQFVGTGLAQLRQRYRVRRALADACASCGGHGRASVAPQIILI
jgi:hypothetical protein